METSFVRNRLARLKIPHELLPPPSCICTCLCVCRILHLSLSRARAFYDNKRPQCCLKSRMADAEDGRMPAK